MDNDGHCGTSGPVSQVSSNQIQCEHSANNQQQHSEACDCGGYCYATENAEEKHVEECNEKPPKQNNSKAFLNTSTTASDLRSVVVAPVHQLLCRFIIAKLHSKTSERD